MVLTASKVPLTENCVSFRSCVIRALLFFFFKDVSAKQMSVVITAHGHLEKEPALQEKVHSGHANCVS